MKKIDEEIRQTTFSLVERLKATEDLKLVQRKEQKIRLKKIFSILCFAQ